MLAVLAHTINKLLTYFLILITPVSSLKHHTSGIRPAIIRALLRAFEQIKCINSGSMTCSKASELRESACAARERMNERTKIPPHMHLAF